MKRILILLLLLSITLLGCTQQKDDNYTKYQECSANCAQLISVDYTTQWLCYKTCRDQYLVTVNDSGEIIK